MARTLATAPGRRVVVFPATVGQQGFWYLDQLQPGNPAYNIAVRFRLQGPLRVDGAGAGAGEIVGRHEALRTTFATDDGAPGAGRVAVRLPLRPSGRPRRCPTVDPRRAEELAEEEAAGASTSPAGRCFGAGCCAGDEEHVLLLTVHHIVSDGWSIGLLAKNSPLSTTPYRRGTRPRSRSCRSSTAISPSGRRSGWRARTWTTSWLLDPAARGPARARVPHGPAAPPAEIVRGPHRIDPPPERAYRRPGGQWPGKHAVHDDAGVPSRCCSSGTPARTTSRWAP